MFFGQEVKAKALHLYARQNIVSNHINSSHGIAIVLLPLKVV
jgi:hypothetical protein